MHFWLRCFLRGEVSECVGFERKLIRYATKVRRCEHALETRRHRWRQIHQTTPHVIILISHVPSFTTKENTFFTREITFFQQVKKLLNRVMILSLKEQLNRCSLQRANTLPLGKKANLIHQVVWVISYM